MSEQSTDLFGSIEIAEEEKSPTPVDNTSAAPPREPRGKPTRSPKRPSGRIVLWPGLIVLLFALYCAGGYLLLPYLITQALPGYIKNKTSVSYRVETVQVNPFRLTLDLQNLAFTTLEEQEDREPFLTIAELSINLEFLSLLRGDLVCSSMTVNRLNLNIIRHRDKSYNLSPLFERPEVRSNSEIINFAELPFLFSLNNINIGDSRILINDQLTQKKHLIEKIELALPALSNFSYQTKSYIHPQFSAVVNGSPVSLSGEAAIGGSDEDGRHTQLSCDINDLDIPLYFDYLPLTLPIDISKGKVNGTLHFLFGDSDRQSGKLSVQFNISASELQIESRDGKLALLAPLARFEGSFEPFSRTLAFQNILFREPALSSQGALTRTTLAGLIPLVLRPPVDDPLYQVIPALSVKLLIADGGSYRINDAEQKAPNHNWQAIQLSVKDFENERLKPAHTESSFRLSAEHATSTAFFSWQGTFDNDNHPGGILQLNNMPASIIAPFLGKEPTDVGGSTDLKGVLNLTRADDERKALAYSLKNTLVTIKDLQLKEHGVVWLHTPTLQCKSAGRVGTVIDLGNVFLPNSSVVIDRQRLPQLFQRFSRRPARYVLHGLDFAGNVKIVDERQKDPLVDLKDVTFQANRLEQKEVQEDNFIFTAQSGPSGEIKAKGSLHLAPLQLSAETAAVDLTPRQLFSWFATSKTLLESQAELSLSGTFAYPEQAFSGNIGAEKPRIGDPKDAPLLQAEKVLLEQVSWSKKRQQLNIESITADQPEFPWRRTHDDRPPATLVAEFLGDIFLPAPDSSPANNDGSPSAFTFHCHTLQINDAALSYQDNRISPALSLGLTGINATITDLSSPRSETKSHITMTGAVEGNPFTLEGDSAFLEIPTETEVRLSSNSFPLQHVAPYIRDRIEDVDLDKAHANISLDAQWTGEASKTKSIVTIEGLVPKKSGGPTAVALALLTDTGGKITLTMNETGEKTNSPLIKHAVDYLSTRFLKAAINPILVSPHDFKDLVETLYVSFQPGTAVLTGESLERLGRYGEFLAVHQLTKLQIKGFADTTTDSAVLHAELTAQEKNRTEAENRTRAREWKKRKEAEKKQRATDGSPIKEKDIAQSENGFVPQSPRKVSVSKKMLAELAERRARAVIDYFVDTLSVDPERLTGSAAETQRFGSDGSFNRADIVIKDRFADSAGTPKHE